MKNPFDGIAPVTRVRHRARKEAEKFALTVKPGVTYYSVVDNHAKYPGAPQRLLLEWVFTARGPWLWQNARCGSMGAATAWLSYGPLHEHRPGGLMTRREWSRRPGLPQPENGLASRDLSPAGV